MQEIGCGYEHSAYVDSKDGQVYTFGSNTFGQCGSAIQASSQPVPFRKLPFFSEIIQVSCGSYFTACLDSYGNVWTFGEARSGQLGLDIDEPWITAPTQVQDLPPIYSVHCGAHHTMCVDENSELWAFGRNYFGQLGLGHFTADVFAPTKVPIQYSVDIVSCGVEFTIIVDSKGKIFSAGCNKSGQLGLGRKGDKQCSFIEMVCDIENICEISSGMSHSVMRCDSGELYLIGYLHGLPEALSPTLIPNIPKMIKVSCGIEQIRCIDEEGFLWSIKDNYSYDFKFVKDPERKVKKIYSGVHGHHVFIVDQDGQIWCKGKNNASQLGIGLDNQSLVPNFNHAHRAMAITIHSKQKSARK